MEENEVKMDIVERHWEQGTHIFSAIIKLLEPSFIDVKSEYNQTVQSIKNEKEPQFLFLVKQSTGESHSVVAYKILDISPDEKRVFVYENNLPYNSPSDNYDPSSDFIKAEDNYITFKPLSNKVSYTLGDHCFDRVSAAKTFRIMGTEEILADVKKNIDIILEWMWDEKLMSFRTRSPVLTLITDNKSGEKIGYENGVFINTFLDAKMEQHLESYLFYLPLDSIYTIEMTGTDIGALGLDFIMPINEDEARIALYENIPVTLNSITTATIDPENLLQQVYSETGEIIIPEKEGELNSFLSLNAKWLKEKAVNNLEQVKTENNRIDEKINSVIENITESLQDNLWQDEAYLNPEQGNKVFAYEIAAIKKMKLYLYLSERSNYHELPENVIFAFEQAIEDLVAADKILAENILEKAKNTLVQKPEKQELFDHMIDKAEQNIEQANQYSVDNPVVAAAFKYGASWYFSQGAIEIAGDN